MRSTEMRLQPAKPEVSVKLLQRLAPHVDVSEERVPNIIGALANHPKLLESWLPFGRYVLASSSLPDRERELLILRTAYLARSPYEWCHHVAMSRGGILTEGEILAVAHGVASPVWSDSDRHLIKAVDDLNADRLISNPTWTALAARWDTTQLMDIVFVVGQYTLLGMALNTFGVQLEADVERFPPSMFSDHTC